MPLPLGRLTPGAILLSSPPDDGMPSSPPLPPHSLLPDLRPDSPFHGPRSSLVDHRSVALQAPRTDSCHPPTQVM
jgi:hypothetical protein